MTATTTTTTVSRLFLLGMFYVGKKKSVGGVRVGAGRKQAQRVEGGEGSKVKQIHSGVRGRG